MGRSRASVVEYGPSVGPFLESQQAWEKHYQRKRKLPDAKDRTKIDGIAKMGEYNSHILDVQEAPECSSRHFKGDEEGANPIGDCLNASQGLALPPGILNVHRRTLPSLFHGFHVLSLVC